MSNYKRSTRVCTFEELQPALQQALRVYFSEHELSDVEAQILICCETHSERKKMSMLATFLGEDLDLVYDSAAFVTPEWLVWARIGDHTTVRVAAARLKDIHVKAVTSLLLKDNGIDIDGFVEGSFSKVHGYIGLGPEPAAEGFWEVVEKAVNTANPPRRLIDLFGKIPH
jgi:hypothetical protein